MTHILIILVDRIINRIYKQGDLAVRQWVGESIEGRTWSVGSRLVQRWNERPFGMRSWSGKKKNEVGVLIVCLSWMRPFAFLMTWLILLIKLSPSFQWQLLCEMLLSEYILSHLKHLGLSCILCNVIPIHILGLVRGHFYLYLSAKYYPHLYLTPYPIWSRNVTLRALSVVLGFFRPDFVSTDVSP